MSYRDGRRWGMSNTATLSNIEWAILEHEKRYHSKDVPVPERWPCGALKHMGTMMIVEDPHTQELLYPQHSECVVCNLAAADTKKRDVEVHEGVALRVADDFSITAWCLDDGNYCIRLGAIVDEKRWAGKRIRITVEEIK